MRLNISRCIGVAMVLATLGLVACAPQNANKQFPAQTENAAATTAEAGKAEGSTEVAAADNGKQEGSEAKSQEQSENSKYQKSATWTFTITDKAVEAANLKPDMAYNVTFQVTNKTADAYAFKVEGREASIESIAAGSTGTCTLALEGPGPLAVSATKISTEKGVDYPPMSTLMMVKGDDPGPGPKNDKAVENNKAAQATPAKDAAPAKNAKKTTPAKK